MHGLIFSGVPREVPECVSGRVLAVIAEAIHEELPRRIFEGIHRRILQDISAGILGGIFQKVPDKIFE